jgi:hypothetical protein
LITSVVLIWNVAVTLCSVSNSSPPTMACGAPLLVYGSRPIRAQLLRLTRLSHAWLQ